LTGIGEPGPKVFKRATRAASSSYTWAASSESAFAGMLAVFAEFEWDIVRDRVKAGIA
jgi:hypothetical protein